MLSSRHRSEGMPPAIDYRNLAGDDIADALYLQDLVLQADRSDTKVVAGPALVMSSIVLAAVLGVAALIGIVIA